MIPTSIEILHDLDNHVHTVCTSSAENHIHKQDIDCNEFHKQITFFSVDFLSNDDVIPQHFYSTIFTDTSQTYKEIYQSVKTTRGPPNFTV